MHEVGLTYILNNNWIRYPKGMKVRLMALIESSFTTLNNEKLYSAIVEVSNGGSEFKYFNEKDTIKVKSGYLTEDTQINFIPLRYLSPLTNDEKYNFIIHNLSIKWNVYETDSYNKYIKEFIDKFGYNIHEKIYK